VAVRSAGLLALVVAAPGAWAQQPEGRRDVGPALATRDYLKAELARLERAGGQQAAAVAALIRTRLDSGDFQAGDRILLRVEGEPQLSDTFAVGPGPTLPLPQLGAVPLRGVLRAELQGYLQEQVARYVRDPQVRARPLMRILVEGEVTRPGVYALSPEQPLADVITVAGGLTQRAKAAKLRVERGGTVIWSGERLQQALGAGRTLDQLSLRAGDRVFVPTRNDFARTAGIIGALMAIPLAVYAIYNVSRGH
jgi:protein involved in polysaccharide export with SLBB domain